MTHPIDAHGFLEERPEGLTVTLPTPDEDRHPPRHVLNATSLNALNAALAAGRPLLVRGEPGTGKSQLALVAAVLLGRALVTHTVDARTDTHDLLYTVDHVARLAQAQLLGALGEKGDRAKAEVAIERFTVPGPLWWAFDWEDAKNYAGEPPHWAPEGWTPSQGTVVLIDEIDKADAMVPNGLLDALGHRKFDAPGGRVVRMQVEPAVPGEPAQSAPRRDHFGPLVIITTNEERSLPDAFLRRCMVLQLHFPNHDDLVARGRAHFPGCDKEVLKAAADQLIKDRKTCDNNELAPPGTAEYIDLLRVLTTMRPDDTEAQLKLLELMAQYTLNKHPSSSPR